MPIIKWIDGYNDLIAVSGDDIQKEIKNNKPAIILGYIELVEEVIRLLNIPPKNLKGGDGFKVSSFLIIPKVLEVKYAFQGKNFFQVKEDIQNLIHGSPFLNFFRRTIIEYGVTTDSGWHRGIDFEQEELVPDIVRFLQEMWDIYPIKFATRWNKEDLLEILKEKADLEKGGIKRISIYTTEEDLLPNTSRRNIRVSWELSLYYKKRA